MRKIILVSIFFINAVFLQAAVFKASLKDFGIDPGGLKTSELSSILILPADNGRVYKVYILLKPGSDSVFKIVEFLSEEINDEILEGKIIYSKAYTWDRIDYKKTKKKIILSTDDFSWEISPDKHRFKITSDNISFKGFTELVSPHYKINDKELAGLKPGIIIAEGFYALYSIKGSMKVYGKKKKINGYGSFKHLFTSENSLRECKKDFVPFFTDSVWGLIIKAGDLTTGFAYLVEEKKYLDPLRLELNDTQKEKKSGFPLGMSVKFVSRTGKVTLSCSSFGKTKNSVVMKIDGKFFYYSKGEEKALDLGYAWKETAVRKEDERVE
ncbi:hypothetical protein ACFLTD_02485 [Elusimicrobiota bacterium]